MKTTLSKQEGAEQAVADDEKLIEDCEHHMESFGRISSKNCKRLLDRFKLISRNKKGIKL